MTMQTKLLAWYEANARKLAFRQNRNPYFIWISESMAQQTRIEAMLPYFENFIRLYPDLPSLAQADDESLHKAWEGLGYYSRCRNLKKCAIECVERFDGRLPSTKAELKTLPGIGDYTAGAIASIAFGEKVSAIDGNVVRVFSRLYDVRADVTKAAKAIHKAFAPDKLNYGAYGDTGCHLHIHLVPKYKDQDEWGSTFQMNPDKKYLSENEYEEMIEKINDIAGIRIICPLKKSKIMT